MSENKNEVKELTTENFATQTLHYVTKKLFLVIAGLMLIIVIGFVAFFVNDERWRTLFSDYDFISQDGEGINSINDGVQGDLNNGATGEKEEGQIDR